MCDQRKPRCAGRVHVVRLVGVRVVVAMVRGPPDRAALHADAPSTANTNCAGARGLERAVREVAVVEAGDREHAQHVQRDRHARRRPGSRRPRPRRGRRGACRRTARCAPSRSRSPLGRIHRRRRRRRVEPAQAPCRAAVPTRGWSADPARRRPQFDAVVADASRLPSSCRRRSRDHAAGIEPDREERRPEGRVVDLREATTLVVEARRPAGHDDRGDVLPGRHVRPGAPQFRQPALALRRRPAGRACARRSP